MIEAKKIDFPSHAVPNDWLFAPSTYLIDSWVPEVEKIQLSASATLAGSLILKISDDEKRIENKELQTKPLIKRVFTASKEIIIKDKIIMDLRYKEPGNIAHALTNHLPLTLIAEDYCKQVTGKSLTIVLPSSIPKYIEKIFVEIGYEVVKTDRHIFAKACEYDISPWQSIRGLRYQIIKTYLSNSDFHKKIQNLSEGLPKKIFISRRGNRVLKNEKIVEDFLVNKGYLKVYAEDFDVLEQISMIVHASHIVAVHGAALGPLLLRAMSPDNNLKLIELFNPGHMTNVYRVICDQLDFEWVGVRGKLWPEIILQAYDEPKDPRKYSLSNFEICLKSLDAAMNQINA
ncbi:DUF563 domain-containing protein [Methylophaga sp.]|uniref:glycosyltransferase family 61 protein n=1 Tax=Methylophaga sp. TaxID=2024840 RepID=UPI002725C660|nr:glycosyltransferase family 61 protein [Methylophaga sp.]MDO8825454.1 glycosyltransferase family 61 protein [Methylophaga sp.]